MTIPTFDHCEVSRDDRGVYTATIANAKSLNILGTPVILSMTEALHWIAAQDDARAVILRGTGDKAFVGGANIYEMAELDAAGGRTFISNLRDLCEAARNMPVPTVARIAGHCLGGGLELAAVCDVRLASDDAIFGMPEVKVGIPSVIHAAVLPGLIGPGPSNWLLLTGENVDAAQALKWGFVQFTAPLAELDALVEKTIHGIVESAPAAVRSQKALIRYWETSSLEDGIARSVEAFGEAFDTGEPAEYMAPFINRKR
ncbi:enoyl-CoA hydratase [Oceanicola sp. 22II-s10i]|uniref:enoyl-CoA hydratase n=1 Tax=Oceanicola sp. 22II-s10i TaxID=1317116 RepID=UPI000B52186B|nr:enoyl-CoA hydratase [Oceanicola sp. 22II-s10i]OWU85516.1 enoyl-CoA hydratase [Oceanicola sp. 22II-s10i]